MDSCLEPIILLFVQTLIKLTHLCLVLWVLIALMNCMWQVVGVLILPAWWWRLSLVVLYYSPPPSKKTLQKMYGVGLSQTIEKE